MSDTETILQWIRSRYFGKYRGTVSDNSDSTARGRLKVKVPSVLGDVELWAMPCVPYAGSKVGFFTLPEAGTGVWVEFEAGDPSYPVWSGFFWGDNDLPSEASGASTKVWKTAKVTITIDDDAGSITITNEDEATITVSDSIELKVDPGTVTIATDSVTSECGTGKVEISATGVSIDDGALQVM
ncbi:MAG: phage baseplate assembly protein V [Terriglobia bacterium]